METIDIVVVRAYITESSSLLDTIISYLIKEAKIRGVSVFRAITGFGTGGIHASTLLDLSLDLPLAIEFFDTKEKADIALKYLATLLKPEHFIFWEAKTNL